jgi:agmatinase
MSINRLRSAPQTFLDVSRTLEESRYVILGAPMDLTGTYRRGSRFAPAAIRRASRYMESYSLRSDLDGEEVPICDAGDLKGGDEVEEWVDQIEALLCEVSASKKVSIILGGEHTITLGAARAFKEAVIVSLDAHLDLRDEFLGRRVSHATFLRRISEEKVDRITLILGARALSREEMIYAREREIRYITMKEIREQGVRETLEKVLGCIPEGKSLYLTLDMDVLDPSEAPAVCNPAPEGIGITDLLELLHGLCVRRRVLGLDLCEVTPYYDSGLTSIQAAKVLLELILSLERGRKGEEAPERRD